MFALFTVLTLFVLFPLFTVLTLFAMFPLFILLATSDNSEEYNLSFLLLELKYALQKSNDSAVGPDAICYKLLTNLSLTFLCEMFYNVFNE